MNIRISKKKLLLLGLFFAFFEPYVIQSLIGRSVLETLLYVIDRLCAVTRWALSGYYIVDFLINKRETSTSAKLLIVFSLLRILSTLMNKTFTFNIVVGNITNIGFVLLIERLFSKSFTRLRDAALLYFGGLALLNVVSIILFPYGFLFDADKADAVYFLGSKNFGFYFYYMYLFFALIKLSEVRKDFTKTLAPALFFLIAAYICNSVNTMFCMIIYILYIIIEKAIRKTVLFNNPRTMIIVMIVLAYIILFGKHNPIISSALKSVGRSMSFTGRDYIWMNVMNQYKDSMLWGLGSKIEIHLQSGAIANHAHNFYVDTLVKYGVFPFASLLASVIYAVNNIVKVKDRKLISALSIMLFIVLLHNMFDDISIFMLGLIFMTIEKQKNKLGFIANRGNVRGIRRVYQ